jgi:thiol-disulfide isomerase/thioredoxin
VTARRRWPVWLASLVIGVVACAAGVWFAGGAPDWAGGRSKDRSAAALLRITLPDAAGHQQALAQWPGKVVVVNFWATWCVPCREEMPEFVRMQKEFGDRGLQFVGIAIDDAAKVDRFARELGLNYPALIGGSGALELSKTLGNDYGVLPFTVVIDRSGRIARTQLGPLKEAELRSILSQLL